jgi:hypothetical protein
MDALLELASYANNENNSVEEKLNSPNKSLHKKKRPYDSNNHGNYNNNNNSSNSDNASTSPLPNGYLSSPHDNTNKSSSKHKRRSSFDSASNSLSNSPSQRKKSKHKEKQNDTRKHKEEKKKYKNGNEQTHHGKDAAHGLRRSSAPQYFTEQELRNIEPGKQAAVQKEAAVASNYQPLYYQPPSPLAATGGDRKATAPNPAQLTAEQMAAVFHQQQQQQLLNQQYASLYAFNPQQIHQFQLQQAQLAAQNQAAAALAAHQAAAYQAHFMHNQQAALAAQANFQHNLMPHMTQPIEATLLATPYNPSTANNNNNNNNNSNDSNNINNTNNSNNNTINNNTATIATTATIPPTTQSTAAGAPVSAPAAGVNTAPASVPHIRNCARHVAIAYYVYYQQKMAAVSTVGINIPKPALELDPTAEARKLKERTEWIKKPEAEQINDNPGLSCNNTNNLTKPTSNVRAAVSDVNGSSNNSSLVKTEHEAISTSHTATASASIKTEQNIEKEGNSKDCNPLSNHSNPLLNPSYSTASQANSNNANLICTNHQSASNSTATTNSSNTSSNNNINVDSDTRA